MGKQTGERVSSLEYVCHLDVCYNSCSAQESLVLIQIPERFVATRSSFSLRGKISCKMK